MLFWLSLRTSLFLKGFSVSISFHQGMMASVGSSGELDVWCFHCFEWNQTSLWSGNTYLLVYFFCHARKYTWECGGCQIWVKDNWSALQQTMLQSNCSWADLCRQMRIRSPQSSGIFDGSLIISPLHIIRSLHQFLHQPICNNLPAVDPIEEKVSKIVSSFTCFRFVVSKDSKNGSRNWLQDWKV